MKPKYRAKVMYFLDRHPEWYSIKEINYVSGMIKEEPQTVKDKARMLGCPSILHKIMVGPVEHNFENLFKEIFPDLWGVGESTIQKENEIDEMIKENGFTNSITIDVSGLDQSHNSLVKMFWVEVVNRVTEFLKIEGNSMFNPEFIKKALLKKETVLVCRDRRNTGLTCASTLRNKMASGQGYTTVLNTSLMCFLLSFAKK
jgi:hypothetical protein